MYPYSWTHIFIWLRYCYFFRNGLIWSHIVSTHIFVYSIMDPYCIDPYFSNFQKNTHILVPIFFIWVHRFGPIFLIWVQKVQIWPKKLPMPIFFQFSKVYPYSWTHIFYMGSHVWTHIFNMGPKSPNMV